MSGNGTRRSFLHKSWKWVWFSAMAAMVYPALRFLRFQTPRQPVIVKVLKNIPVGGYAVEKDFILFVAEDGPWAVSRRCTHLGCRLNFIEKENNLLCPCHSSRFTARGKRLSGPANKDLANYPVARLGENEGKGFVVTL